MAGARKTPPFLEWRAWPAATYPVRSAVALVVVVGATAAVFSLLHHAGWTALFVAVLIASLHGHFLPRRYRLDDAGVTVWTLGVKKFRPWDFFHSYYADKMGVMLSTFTFPSRLDTFRGTNLRFSRGADAEAVLAFVAGRLPRATSRPKGRRGGEVARAKS